MTIFRVRIARSVVLVLTVDVVGVNNCFFDVNFVSHRSLRVSFPIFVTSVERVVTCMRPAVFFARLTKILAGVDEAIPFAVAGLAIERRLEFLVIFGHNTPQESSSAKASSAMS